MKIFFCIMLMLAPLSALAQESYSYIWLEPQFALQREFGDGSVKRYDWFATLSGATHTKGIGAFAEVSYGESWGEWMVGPSFAPSQFLELSVGYGGEFKRDGEVVENTRYRVNIYYTDPKTESLLHVQQDFGEGAPWTFVDVVLFPTSGLGLGAILQAPDLGAGPKLEVRLGKYVGLWVSLVRNWTKDDQRTRTLVGGRLMFNF